MAFTQGRLQNYLDSFESDLCSTSCKWLEKIFVVLTQDRTELTFLHAIQTLFDRLLRVSL